jgi:hypothetical protein
MSAAVVLAWQAAALLWTFVTASLRVLLDLPYALLRCGVSAGAVKALQNGFSAEQCTFYEGTVKHVRKRPAHHAFE